MRRIEKINMAAYGGVGSGAGMQTSRCGFHRTNLYSGGWFCSSDRADTAAGNALLAGCGIRSCSAIEHCIYGGDCLEKEGTGRKKRKII